jgi:hypothetical protein
VDARRRIGQGAAAAARRAVGAQRDRADGGGLRALPDGIGHAEPAATRASRSPAGGAEKTSTLSARPRSVSGSAVAPCGSAGASRPAAWPAGISGPTSCALSSCVGSPRSPVTRRSERPSRSPTYALSSDGDLVPATAPVAVAMLLAALGGRLRRRQVAAAADPAI